MSFQSLCNLLEFEKSIQLLNFDKNDFGKWFLWTIVHAVFMILGEKIMCNKIDMI